MHLWLCSQPGASRCHGRGDSLAIQGSMASAMSKETLEHRCCFICLAATCSPKDKIMNL